MSEWTIVHPYNFDTEMPAEPQRYTWEIYIDGGWEKARCDSVIKDEYTYRYRLPEPKYDKLMIMAHDIIGYIDEGNDKLLVGALTAFIKETGK